MKLPGGVAKVHWRWRVQRRGFVLDVFRTLHAEALTARMMHESTPTQVTELALFGIGQFNLP